MAIALSKAGSDISYWPVVYILFAKCLLRCDGVHGPLCILELAITGWPDVLYPTTGPANDGCVGCTGRTGCTGCVGVVGVVGVVGWVGVVGVVGVVGWDGVVGCVGVGGTVGWDGVCWFPIAAI